VGNSGVILISNNGGLNWSIQSSPTSSFLKSVHFINTQTGWAVGSNGVVIRTGIPVNIVQSENSVPLEFILNQNYPNPFNPKTNIKYQILKSGLVKLTIFDILGRKIETLVNEDQTPGTYLADWYAEKYPSGIYYYTLITDDYTETKKMVLVK
jgi:hypothetical protein